MRVLMAAGGTGGHLLPAIRIAEAVKRLRDDTEIMFVGSDRGFEKSVIAARGYRYVGLPARGLARTRIWRNLAGMWGNARAFLLARRVVKDFAPHVAVGCGGYASYFPIRAARAAGVPYVLQEQNRTPGLSTRWLCAHAEQTFIAFEQSAELLPRARSLETVGNPVDPRLSTLDRGMARRCWHLDTDETVVLVTGGSGGARSINDNIAEGLHQPCPCPPVAVLWQTGRHHAEWDGQAAPGWRVQSFEFTDRMTEALVAADLVIARAGALTVSEIAAAGRPAILVPFPFATADHQTHNARVLSEAGGAVLIPDNQLRATQLLHAACELLRDPARLRKMEETNRSLGQPRAADRIAAFVITLAERTIQTGRAA